MTDLLIAELDSPETAIATARRVRELGYGRLEAYVPFPISELDDALAIRRTRTPYIVLLAGIAGAAIALLIQWWTNAWDYPLDVGGRPRFSIPTDIPIVFETTVLFAASAAFACVLLGARLPRLHDPVFDLPGFERTSIDRFWIVVGDAFSMADDIQQAEEASPRDERRCALLHSLQDEEIAKLTSELRGLGAVVTRGRIERSQR